MALNPHVTAARRKAAIDTFIASAASGILRIYSGSQPADADAAVGGGTILAELTMNATAFTSPSAVASTDHVLTANAITQDSSANATGTAAWFRLFQSDGTTPLMDGTVGTAGCDLNLNTVSIVSGGAVSVTSFTITFPK